MGFIVSRAEMTAVDELPSQQLEGGELLLNDE
jgi:hypothetical protein